MENFIPDKRQTSKGDEGSDTTESRVNTIINRNKENS